MKLVANSGATGNATLAIRWCLEDEEISALRELVITDPYILFVVVHKHENVDRKLVRLNELMVFLPLNNPGDNTVFATIVWHKTKKKLDEWCLERNKYGCYKTDFYDIEDDSLRHGDLGKTRMEVNVSSEFFAKEPPAWEKKWVNLWFGGKRARNSCDYGKRRMLAYSVQPIPVLVFIVFITIFRFLAAAFWILIRTKTKVDLRPIIHPFKYESDDVWFYATSARNFYEKDKDGKDRATAVWLYHPVTIIVMAVVLFYITIDQPRLFVSLHIPSVWWAYILLSPIFTTLLAIGAIVVAVVIVGLVKLGFLIFSRFFPSKSEEQSQELLEEKTAEQIKAEQEEADLKLKLKLVEDNLTWLACNQEQPVPKLSALPREKRTVYLHFLDLKSKWCKPFPGV
ncbi:MAG: hypothetical protein WC863_01940 [Patescibacteria group bacterium]